MGFPKRRGGSRALAGLVGAGALFAAFAAPAETSSDDKVVVRVGAHGAATVAQVRARVAAMPWFQLSSLGRTPGEIRGAVIDRVIVPELLDAEEADARGLRDDPSVRDRITEALRTARLESLRDEVAAHPATAGEVDAYYESHRAEFERPPRIGILRILCETREQAASVLDEARKAGSLERWNELARERSQDRATAFRGGDLGMLAPDGTSDLALVKGDPALVAAASRVADGQLIPEPVAEGEKFAAVWRRGSLAAVRTPRADADRAIRALLQRDALEKAAHELVASLRARARVEVDQERLKAVVWDLPDFGIARRAPTPAPPSSAAVHPQPVPVPGPGGLR